MRVAFGLLFAAATLSSAAGAAVAANPSSPLNICIVEARPSLFTGEAFRRGLVERLSRAVAPGASSLVELAPKPIGGWAAAARLKRGECDAVLVLGPTRPVALRRLPGRVVAASLGVAGLEASVFLIVPRERTPAREKLVEEFARAVRDTASPASRAVAANGDGVEKAGEWRRGRISKGGQRRMPWHDCPRVGSWKLPLRWGELPAPPNAQLQPRQDARAVRVLPM